MPYKYKRSCPICKKPDLSQLNSHLRQAHGLDAQQRQKWLKQAVHSMTLDKDETKQSSMPANTTQSETKHHSLEATGHSSDVKADVREPRASMTKHDGGQGK